MWDLWHNMKITKAESNPDMGLLTQHEDYDSWK